MEDSPSFSLGLTQLDNNETTNSLVDVVPLLFANEEPNFYENRSKNLNDPIRMKKIIKASNSRSKKEIGESSRKLKKKDNSRPRLPKGMKYRIKNIPAHSLHFDSYCNRVFGSYIKNCAGEETYNLFHQTIFGSFLDMPQCNFQSQISKCILMLELEQENSDEIYVYVQGIILKFTISEFALISGLKCTGNIEEHLYTHSSKSLLMAKYFSSSKHTVKKCIFVQRFKAKFFDNNTDALNMSILYFIHTFLFSQVRDATISRSNFVMVEDGRYEQFPWGKASFKKLIATWRQDFFVQKQLYSIGGMPHVLNVWMYECCSEVDSTIPECVGNVIPRIFNC